MVGHISSLLFNQDVSLTKRKKKEEEIVRLID